jgi:cold shock CspA family protein
MKVKGQVLWYNKNKGFGVAKYDDKEYFIHHSETKKLLRENDIIEFEIEEERNKLCAKKIKLIRKPKNTENFNPCHEPADLRVLIGNSSDKKYHRDILSRDIIIIPNFMDNLYDDLINEIDNCKKNDLWKLWHGDTHLIADDHLNWKNDCPLFNKIMDRIKEYFEMEIKATRFNLYQNSDHWKPFHHDAAAVKSHIAKTQNLTVGISFGAERDIAFEHAKTKSTISFPLPSGTLYAFAKDVNIIWKHGIPQLSSDKRDENGRISIIAWGKNKQH